MTEHIPPERDVKLARVREILARRDAASVSLTSKESLAWLLDGARVTVPISGDPVLSAIVTRDSLTLHVAANEADRLVAEELGSLDDVEVVPVPWYERLRATGAAELTEADVAAELRAARARLLPGEIARYRELGTDAATAVTTVLASLAPEDSERDLAAALAAAVYAVGAEPVVILTAGEGRLAFRHPLATDARLGRRAMAVVGARRRGLIVNFTRWLGHDADGDDALREVEADAWAATRPGRRLADVLGDIAAAYERHGFAADEWLRHHQGGPTGYAGRDPKVTPGTDDLVCDVQAFAWNPTAAGIKIEDTVLLSGGQVEVLTCDRAWPAVDTRGVPRPLALPYA